MATSGLDFATPGSVDKHLNLLSHGGVLSSGKARDVTKVLNGKKKNRQRGAKRKV